MTARRDRQPMKSKLANPDSPIVKRALERSCPACKARPGAYCVTNNELSKGRPLKNRIVHYARVELRPTPP
jgi:hypothetical protein